MVYIPMSYTQTGYPSDSLVAPDRDRQGKKTPPSAKSSGHWHLLFDMHACMNVL